MMMANARFVLCAMLAAFFNSAVAIETEDQTALGMSLAQKMEAKMGVGATARLQERAQLSAKLRAERKKAQATAARARVDAIDAVHSTQRAMRHMTPEALSYFQKSDKEKQRAEASGVWSLLEKAKKSKVEPEREGYAKAAERMKEALVEARHIAHSHDKETAEVESGKSLQRSLLELKEYREHQTANPKLQKELDRAKKLGKMIDDFQAAKTSRDQWIYEKHHGSAPP